MPRTVARTTEAVQTLRETSPETLHGLLDNALRIARALPVVPNGGKVSADRTTGGERRAVIGLESLGTFRLGDERLAVTVDASGTVRAAVLDGTEMRLREVGELGKVARFAGKDGVSVARFPTLAEAIAPGLVAEVRKARISPPQPQTQPQAPRIALGPPAAMESAPPLPSMEVLGRIRDAEAGRVVQRTYAAGYEARLDQLRGAQALIAGRGLVAPGQLDGLERAGQYLDKLRDRADRAGQLSGLKKVLAYGRAAGHPAGDRCRDRAPVRRRRPRTPDRHGPWRGDRGGEGLRRPDDGLARRARPAGAARDHPAQARRVRPEPGGSSPMRRCRGTRA